MMALKVASRAALPYLLSMLNLKQNIYVKTQIWLVQLIVTYSKLRICVVWKKGTEYKICISISEFFFEYKLTLWICDFCCKFTQVICSEKMVLNAGASMLSGIQN